MPVDITTRELQPEELAPMVLRVDSDRPEFYEVQLPASHPLLPSTFGLLAPESPLETLHSVLFDDIGRTLVSAFCPETRRGSLLSVSVDHVDWSACSQHLDFLSNHGVGKSVEVTVIKIDGRVQYLMSRTPAATFEQSEDCTEIRRAFEQRAIAVGLTATFTVHIAPPSTAAVALHREAGQVEILLPNPSVLANVPFYADMGIAGASSFEDRLKSLRLFTSAFVAYSMKIDYQMHGINVPAWMTYDGTDEVLSPARLLSGGRRSLRAKVTGCEPEGFEVTHCGHKGPTTVVTVPDASDEAMLEHLAMFGPWCEVCAKREGRVRMCSVCKGASYCSVGHQSENWKAHKNLVSRV
jgi:hypothetical protein